MQRKTRALLAASVFAVATPFVQPGLAAAGPVEDQRREVERIVDQLAALEEQADILAEDYVVAVDEKNQLDKEVAAAEVRVAEMEGEVEALRGELSAVAVRAFTGSGGDVLGPLFSNAGAYNDVLQRDQYSRVALEVGTATTDDLDEVIVELQAEREDLADKRERAEQLTEQIADAQSATDAKKVEYVEARAAAEAKLGNLIEEEQQRRAEEAWRRIQEEAAERERAATPAQPATSNGGGGNGGDSGGGDTGARNPQTVSAPAPSGGGNGGGGGQSAAPAPAPAPAPEPVNYPAPSSLAQVAIDAALAQRGVPYRYATSNPGVSFDCSGLTAYAWGQAGVSLPHQSRSQAASLPHVPASSAQPGDLIFYYSPISHVGIYLGGGQLVHAPYTGTVVKVASVNWNKVTVVARPG